MHTRILEAAILVALMVGSGGVLSAQASVAAEEGAGCKSCAHNLTTDEHFFNGWFGCSGGGTCKDCNVFNSCHGDPQTPFSCEVFHWECGATSAVLDAVDKAMEGQMGDAAIIRVAEELPRYVTVVAAGYVVVKGCRGEIVAAYKVTPATLARMANKKEGRHMSMSFSFGGLLGVQGAS